MKCTHCGAELAENDKLCNTCGKPVDAENMPAETVDENAGTAADAGSTDTETTGAAADTANTESDTTCAADVPPVSTSVPAADKKKGKIAALIIAAAAVIGVAAFAAVKMTAKDPKEVVIAAFENIWPEDQVSPTEELFGTSELAKAMSTTDSETSLSLKLDSCSDDTVNSFAGSGLRIAGKNDITNKKSSFNMGVTYNDMDAANLNVYYGDETLMMALPELVDKVFTLDLSEGLADRVKNSPTVGTYLAQSGVDVDAMAAYLQEMMDEAANQSETGTAPFDVEALMTRYKEGCKAQENFKAALTVEKSGKGTFTMDGKEVSCTGYNVTVSKDSMIEFLRVSSDFFLQDETLKNDFLKQLEASVRMSEIMGAAAYGGTAQTPEEMQQQTYDELKNSVDEMITYLDGSLSDIQMVVYVDKAGRLASVDGKTTIRETAEEGTGELDNSVDIAFLWNLEGGAYLTQNMNGSITLSNPEDAADKITVTFNRQGTYDKASLTDDFSVTFDGGADQQFRFMYTTTYYADNGSFHAAAEIGSGGSQLLKISGTGVVDEMEKGKSFHITIDELETNVMDSSINVMMSGEYSLAPLQGEITAPEGEQMDVLAATEADWQGVFMQGLFGAMSVMQELGIQ